MSRRAGSITTIVIVVVATATAPLVAQAVISADGVVESTSGGFKFPDGSVQTTAVGAADACPTLDPSDEMLPIPGVCIDKYEASIWSQPDGGMQYGVESDDYPCSDTGQDCDNIYALSLPGVTPSRFMTWFQAQAALANSGKRFPTNAEWQLAALGTPDPGDTPGSEDCNTSSVGPEVTGERANCVSRWGHHDMVGNVLERVADWDEIGTICQNWTSLFGDDATCIGRMDGDASLRRPGDLVRGGYWEDGTDAGLFAIRSGNLVGGGTEMGFRGAR